MIRWWPSVVLASGLALAPQLAIGQMAAENAVVARPTPSTPADPAGRAALRAANAASGLRILVSVDQRWLWVLNGRDTLMSVPAAVGIGRDFEFNGKKFHFATPRGVRRVLGKQPTPIWTVPEWHYLEKAHRKELEVVHLKPEQKYLLEDGTFIDVRGDQVGRLNLYGNWFPFSQDFEIIFDGKIFVPPLNTIQRRVTNALGPYKLDTGNGYLIHGTHEYNEESIGEAVSHGCVRLNNDDLRKLYAQVPVGTRVYIF